MYKRHITSSFAIGKTGENRLKEILQSFGLESESSSHKDRYDYDVRFFMGGRALSVEVKYDLYAKKSGNVAIEYYNTKLGKPSGITVTKAELWSFVFFDKSTYITSTDMLKDYITHHHPVKSVSDGGDKNAALLLYNQKSILNEIFHRVDVMDASSFVELINQLCPKNI